jgi:hypothetical protein
MNELIVEPSSTLVESCALVASSRAADRPSVESSTTAVRQVTQLVRSPGRVPAALPPSLVLAVAASLLTVTSGAAQAHGVSAEDARRLASGAAWLDHLGIGARHMLSGVDHLLFLLGVVFYLRQPLDVLLYVSLFSLGHSASLLAGATLPWQANAALVDAVIGLSVAYKAFDNLRGFQDWFGRAPDARWAIALFGLVHGLGLATSLRTLHPPRDPPGWT